jgi:hypothetical protein
VPDSEQVIDQRHQRRALSRTRPGKHAGVVPMIVGQNRGLLCSGSYGIESVACSSLSADQRAPFKSSRHRLSPLSAHVEDDLGPRRSRSHRWHVPVGGESMRSFSISAFFPEVKPAHAAFQSCVSKASEMDIAVSRGLSELRARPGVNGKRISEVRLTIKEIEPTDES